MADKIGKTAEQVWPWMVKQQMIEGIMLILGFCLIFGIWLYGGHLLKTPPDWCKDEKGCNVGGRVWFGVSSFI